MRPEQARPAQSTLLPQSKQDQLNASSCLRADKTLSVHFPASGVSLRQGDVWETLQSRGCMSDADDSVCYCWQGRGRKRNSPELCLVHRDLVNVVELAFAPGLSVSPFST